MADGVNCGLRIFGGELPLLPGAAEYAAKGLVPGGTGRNKEGRLRALPRASEIAPELLDILFDPQTSGGLLAAVPRGLAHDALSALRGAGVDASIVGESGGPPGQVDIAL
jgi:selenide,water dikinase